VGQVLGQELAAAQRAGGGNDGTVPVGNAVETADGSPSPSWLRFRVQEMMVSVMQQAFANSISGAPEEQKKRQETGRSSAPPMDRLTVEPFAGAKGPHLVAQLALFAPYQAKRGRPVHRACRHPCVENALFYPIHRAVSRSILPSLCFLSLSRPFYPSLRPSLAVRRKGILLFI
jgi:hypothetical protein